MTEQPKQQEVVKSEPKPVPSTNIPATNIPIDLSGISLSGLGSLEDFEKLYRVCSLFCNSEMVPKNYRGKPADMAIAVIYGHEIGLKFMQSIQAIAVINGKPALPSEAMLAIVTASGKLEYLKEATIEEIKETGKAWCELKRADDPVPIRHAWTVDDAKDAGLWMKRGYNNTPTPWVTYPFRMLQLKPRGWALKDKFADMLRGFISVEEAEEIAATEKENSATGQIEAKSQPETKGAELAKVLDEAVRNVAPVPAETPPDSVPDNRGEESQEPAQETPESSQEAVPASEVGEGPDRGLRDDIDALVQVLLGSDLGKAAYNKVLGKLKVKLAKGQQPLDVLPREKWELYRAELNSALDGLNA